MVSESTPPHPATWFPQPVRKQVTVLFCDVVDYTARAVCLDPEDLADEIRVFQTLCGEVSHKHHGHIANYLGDGILVLFGHPYANEFAPQHAAHAGMEMVAQTQRNNAAAHWRGRQPIKIRVGIATGLVVVGERAGAARDQDELIFGEAPNLAARLQGLAEPNTVLTALRTRRLVGAAFKFRDRGEHRVKGFAQPVSAWQILCARPYQSRARASLKRVTTRFISRQPELQSLQHYYAQARRGRGCILHVSGDPGIGKSRLIRAFEKTIPKQSLHRLRIHCSPYFRTTPFKPIINETHRWRQIGAQDDLTTKRDNIHQAMREIGLDGQDEHALFSELLAIPMPPGHAALNLGGEEKHRRSVQALATVVIRLSRLHPLLLVVEDLHWADPSTLEVLTALIARARAEKLLAIFTSRSGFVAPWSAAESAALIHIQLGGLDAEESARLIESVCGAQQLPRPIQQALIRKSGGVPLFLEETSQHLLSQLDHGQINDRDDHDRAVNFTAQFTIPDTLQDSLNARLDQLGEAKAFAQLVAVFGNDFRYSLSSKIAAKNGIDADAGMDTLLEAELIAVVAAQPEASEDYYQFRHALFQDAAYYSLLRKTRQQYHLQIVELLLQDNPDLARQHPEWIAEHYSHTERVDKAVDLWLRAARQAIAKSAINEALERLARGLALLEKLPDDAHRHRCELSLRLNLGVALTARSGYHGAQVMQSYEQALALAEAAASEQQTWTALYGLWRCLVSQADFSKALRVAVKLKLLSEKSADAKLMMTAYGLQGMTRMVSGKFAAAEHFYDKAVRLYDQHRDQNMGVRFGQDPYVTLQGLGAINALILNKTPTSRAAMHRSVAVARATNHPYTVAETLRVAAMYQQIAGDWEALKAFAEETVALSTAHGFEGLLAAGKIFLAFHHAARHGAAAQTDRMQRHLQNYADNYGKLFLPYFYGVLAEAHIAGKNYAAALRATQQALAMVQQFGEEWSRAPLLAIQVEAATHGELASAAEIARWRNIGLETATAQQAWLIRDRLQGAPRNCDAAASIPLIDHADPRKN